MRNATAATATASSAETARKYVPTPNLSLPFAPPLALPIPCAVARRLVTRPALPIPADSAESSVGEWKSPQKANMVVLSPKVQGA